MADLQLIFKALTFAAEKHKNQRRKDSIGTPYINHPIGVAANIIEFGQDNDTATIIAAILHDTIEDTNTTYEEILDNFGKEIADIVMECTDNKKLPRQERKDLQVINASHKSDKAKVVKMADKLHNLNDLLVNPPPDWTCERVSEYFQWSKKITDQMLSANEGLGKALEKTYIQFGNSC